METFEVTFIFVNKDTFLKTIKYKSYFWTLAAEKTKNLQHLFVCLYIVKSREVKI